MQRPRAGGQVSEVPDLPLNFFVTTEHEWT